MGIFSAIADTFGSLWKVDAEETNDDELVVYQDGDPEKKRIFSESKRTIKNYEKELESTPKSRISPKASVNDTKTSDTRSEKEQDEREI